MDAEKCLTPDNRWTLWKCTTHQDYLDKFCIKGKFHSRVPDEIRSSYEIVERLIAYSYFHYPMIEEAISKMTRIFEMSVKIRAKLLGIEGQSLNNCLNKLKNHPEIDPDMETEWLLLKDIRNLYAHPDSHFYSGPSPLRSLYSMINIINRLFCSRSLFEDCYNSTATMAEYFTSFNEGVFILEVNDLKRLIICARPYFISSDLTKSLWQMDPVGVLFPQKIHDYNDLNPIFARLTDLHIENEMIIAMDSITNSKVIIYKTTIEGNVTAADSFLQKYRSADESVRNLHDNNAKYHRYFEKQRFIYDEFWEQ